MFRYQRRDPEQMLLHRIVRESPAFLAEATDRYPICDHHAFIAAEFERYLRCGIIRYGFPHIRWRLLRGRLFTCRLLCE
jgi:hypothetical protein